MSACLTEEGADDYMREANIFSVDWDTGGMRVIISEFFTDANVPQVKKLFLRNIAGAGGRRGRRRRSGIAGVLVGHLARDVRPRDHQLLWLRPRR